MVRVYAGLQIRYNSTRRSSLRRRLAGRRSQADRRSGAPASKVDSGRQRSPEGHRVHEEAEQRGRPGEVRPLFFRAAGMLKALVETRSGDELGRCGRGHTDENEPQDPLVRRDVHLPNRRQDGYLVVCA